VTAAARRRSTPSWLNARGGAGADRPPRGAPATSVPLRVALVGNPNTGKSTVFNALTGLRQRVANFAGVTVERVEGSYAYNGHRFDVIDLPGAYSLTAESPDEVVVTDVLLGRSPGVLLPNVVVIVVDAENLERNLFLVSQVLDLGLPTVVALNRVDRLEISGTRIDVIELIRELGTTVVPIVATRGEGIDQLRRVIALAPSLPRSELVGTLPVADAECGPGEPEVTARYKWTASVIASTVVRRSNVARTPSDRIDALVLHRVWGPLIFLAVMAMMFQAMFSWARPLMAGLQALVSAGGVAATAVLPPGDLRSLIVNGAIAGVGSVVVFLPQIAILFLLIGVLEDSGYMARAAFVMDRFMRPIGLNGKSFIPLISGYACAVPAIMAARTIKEPKERLATILVVPLMSCSARLPVYTLLISAFVPAIMIRGLGNLQGLTLLGMYLLGTVGAFIMASVFRRTLLRSPTRALILELPPYCLPNVRVLASSVWQRVRLFLRRAGTVIFAVSIVLWTLATYPRSPADRTSEARLAHSALGRVGRAIEPAVHPLGYDWKIGVSIISSFAAREVFVSTMATIYGVGDGAADVRQSLGERLRAERDARGALVFTPIIALGLMAFYVFALMCTSTIAVTVRECGGGWRGARWATLQFAYMLVLAYAAAFTVYRVGLALWPGVTS
jgi:ferrous iron transport protein B